MGRKIHVYASQYGAWYGLTRDEWAALVAEGVKGEGHTLPWNRMLAGRPSTLRGSGRDVWTTNGVKVVFCLDWDADDWAYGETELLADAPPKG